MTSEQHLPGHREPPEHSLQQVGQTPGMVQSDQASEGGDPACWACMVCAECGAVIAEGHRTGCSQAGQPANSLGAA